MKTPKLIVVETRKDTNELDKPPYEPTTIAEYFQREIDYQLRGERKLHSWKFSQYVFENPNFIRQTIISVWELPGEES